MTALQFGIMNRGQFPVGDDAKLHWDEMVEQARVAERLKFDSIMKGSHYSSWPLMDFQQVPFLARMSANAPRCGCSAASACCRCTSRSMSRKSSRIST